MICDFGCLEAAMHNGRPRVDHGRWTTILEWNGEWPVQGKASARNRPTGRSGLTPGSAGQPTFAGFQPRSRDDKDRLPLQLLRPRKRFCAAALVLCARPAYYPRLGDDPAAPLSRTTDKSEMR
jgi:hypothetical protein